MSSYITTLNCTGTLQLYKCNTVYEREKNRNAVLFDYIYYNVIFQKNL